MYLFVIGRPIHQEVRDVVGVRVFFCHIVNICFTPRNLVKFSARIILVMEKELSVEETRVLYYSSSTKDPEDQEVCFIVLLDYILKVIVRILPLLFSRVDQFIHVIGTTVCGVVVLGQHLTHLLHVFQSVGKVIIELELWVMLDTLGWLHRF